MWKLCNFRWLIPESPRWLLAMGRVQEVMSILRKASVVNNKELPHNIDKKIHPSSVVETESAGVMDLFRTRRLRRNTLLLFVIWFSVYLVYYGLVLNVGNIGGDLYINSVSHWSNQNANWRLEEPKILFLAASGHIRWEEICHFCFKMLNSLNITVSTHFCQNILHLYVWRDIDVEQSPQ